MADQPDNPYVHDDPNGAEEQLLVTRPLAWVTIVLFLLVCTLPPLWRNTVAAPGGTTPLHGEAKTAFQAFSGWGEDTTLRQHLRKAEGVIEDAPFTVPPRRAVQRFLTENYGEGNTKTVVGRDGWLFFRPAIQALTGAGPLEKPAFGPATDPALRQWRPAIDAARQFAADLADRGVELVLVPVPVKPMIHPEELTGTPTDGPVAHPDAAAFYAETEAAGPSVTVLDLSDGMWARKSSGPVFMKQDTHWTPETMAWAAGEVADHLRSRDWWAEVAADTGADPGRYAVTQTPATGEGDLVVKLDFAPGESPFDREAVTVGVVEDTASGGRPKNDPDSPVVLLGDSFVNIFDDRGLEFTPGGKDGASGSAGFAQHLAAKLGIPIDTIARNGEGSTPVRAEFANRPDNEVRAKRAVVWVIASRDLFYSPSLAAANSVSWGNVTWNPAQRTRPELPAGAIEVEATLANRATLPDPSDVNYPHSTYQTLWNQVTVTRGDAGAVEDDGNGKLLVTLWGFRDKKVVPTGQLEAGRRYRFAAAPLGDFPEAESAAKAALDLDVEDLLLEEYFAEAVEAVE